jgi:hypothetical protein
MRFAVVLEIFRKELTETLRDRRTLTMMIALPVLLYPLLMIGFGKLQVSQREATEERVSRIAVWGVAPAGLRDALTRGAKVTIDAGVTPPGRVRHGLDEGTLARPDVASRDDSVAARPDEAAAGEFDADTREPDHPVLEAARAAVTAKRVDAVLVLWPDVAPALAGAGAGSVSIYFDSVREDSLEARSRLEASLGAYREGLVAERERARGLARGFALGLDVRATNVAREARQSGQILGLFLPFLRDPRWFLVRNTIFILRRIAGPEVAREISRCASHGDPRVRKEALLYFDENSDPAGESVLLSYLADDTPSLRIAAIRSLARRGSRTAADRLLALTASPAFAARERLERETVWEALGALAPGKVFQTLKAMLLKRRLFGQAKDLDDTACACAGLRRIGTPEAIEILRQAADGKRGEARELVEKALRSIARGRAAGEAGGSRDGGEADRG